MIKFNTFIIFSLVLSFVFIPITVASDQNTNEDQFDDMFSEAQESGESVNIDETSPGSGTAPEDTPVEQQGRQAQVGGDIELSMEGKFNTEKLETDTGDEGNDIKGFNYEGNEGYSLDFASFWETPTHTVISGQNIQKQGDELTVGEGETVDTEEELGSHVQEYESDDEGFSLGGAKAVVLDDTIFTDIKDSSFKTDNDELVEAEITSASDNNSFSFKDIDVSFDKDDTIQLKKNKTSGKYDVSVDSENGTVEDYEGNVACADVSSGSRYRYQDGESNEHFGLYVPSSAESFKLCIKTEEAESYKTNCSQCGVVDFINHTAELNGQYEFEKHDLDPRLFTNVIDGGLRFPP